MSAMVRQRERDPMGRVFAQLTAMLEDAARRKYHYYVGKAENEHVVKPTLRFSAPTVEEVVVGALREFLRDEVALIRTLSLKGNQISHALEAARRLAEEGAGHLVHRYVHSVTLNASSFRLAVDMTSLSEALIGHASDCSRHEIAGSLEFRRRGKQVKLVSQPTAAVKPDPAILLVVARAFDWFERLATGEAKSIAELAASDGFDAGYVSHVLRLASLPPSQVEAICSGTWASGMTAKELLWNAELSLTWKTERSQLDNFTGAGLEAVQRVSVMDPIRKQGADRAQPS